jgi:endonuclease III
MPVATNKQRIISQVFSALKKQYEPGEPAERPVLEQLLYAVLREGSTREQADRAFRKLQDRFFDWNEIRVSSPHEIEEALDGLSNRAARAQRLVGLLQEVFETTFSFDLESLHKKGLKQSAKQLGRYQSANDYVVAWVLQQTLGGHAIPLDEPTLRVLRRLGLLDEGDADNLEAARASLEHQIPKARGPLFNELMSLVARDYCHEKAPNCPACPLRGDCPTGQENLANGTGRSSRPKPR